jgi:hypothetical protein
MFYPIEREPDWIKDPFLWEKSGSTPNTLNPLNL